MLVSRPTPFTQIQIVSDPLHGPFLDPAARWLHFPAELISSRRQHMKHASWIVVVALVALSGMAAAQLSSNSRIVTQVPFEFVVGNQIVPAGECVVQIATMDGNTLSIRNTGTKVNLFASTSRDEGKKNASQYALVFKRYGDSYFLSGIKLQGSKVRYRLYESKGEAELRAQKGPATEETLLASLQ
jgi:hypothetical protein